MKSNDTLKAGNTMRVWLPKSDLEELRKMSNETGLSQSLIAQLLCRAGVHAVSGHPFVLPFKFVATAARLDAPLARLLAVQYFAGLRPAEAARLAEGDILPAGYIAVSAAKSKTRQRRLVKILPNLKAWLALEGELPVSNLVKRFRRVRAAAGVPWPPDVTRHSFASYHLARWRAQDRTATELGHRSSAMLFAHYRELVTAQAAREYFAIKP